MSQDGAVKGGLSDAFIRRPIATLMLMVGLLLVGTLAYGTVTGRWPQGPAGYDHPTGNAHEIEMLRADAGGTLGFSRVVARRRRTVLHEVGHHFLMDEEEMPH